MPKKKNTKKKTRLNLSIKIAISAFGIAVILSSWYLMSEMFNLALMPSEMFPLNSTRRTTISTSIQDQLDQQSQIKKFGNYDELRTFLEENQEIGGYYGIEREARTFEAVSEPMSLEFAKSQATDAVFGFAPEEPTDFSTTNIQVAGVDEADIVKTDGNYIYAVSKNNLFIIKSYPAQEAEVISQIAFKSAPQDIFINGNNLVVFGYDSDIYNKEIAKTLPFIQRSSYTFFKVFDITDKKNPTQVRDINFEGNYTNSRMIGDYIYFITTRYNYFLDDDIIIPRIIENGQVLTTDKSAERCNCPDVYYFDMPYQDYNFTSIAAINVSDNSQPINNEIYLLSSNQNMYVSQDNIYITYTKYINEESLMLEVVKEIVLPQLNEKKQAQIAKIEAVDHSILNKQEKLAKIGLIIQSYIASLTNEEQDQLEETLEKAIKQKYKDISKELEKTVIHKIGINKENLEYKTFGEVTGQVLNQFSMSENNGYFRIATTKNRQWSRFEDEGVRESYNNLYVLDENLKVVGAVEDLAEGERIYSVRFMQDRAYMVTFRQTDPLFVIDLKNPTNPRVLGKLKIPGFSNYLHPYDDNTLIGLGKDTKENEWGGVTTLGVKLSLFDVTDVSNPREIDTYIIGKSGTNSIALQDHKAFLFSKDKNLLVIPISKRNDVIILEAPTIECIGAGCIMPRPPKRTYFRGAMVFKIDNNGFELKGEINHSNDEKDEIQYQYGYNYYDTTVKRSLYIDDVLYTLSNKYLKMNNLDDLELVKNLRLEKEKGDFEIIN